MGEKHGNPQAYPSGDPFHGGNEGMSLRDYFAGQALAGIGTWMPGYSTPELANPETLRQRATWAYQQADAMLGERNA